MKSRNQATNNALDYWRENVKNDRLAHLIRGVARAQMRALQNRLVIHGVSFGHWSFLRILWATDGLTQKELSDRAGVMEPTTFTAMKALEKMGVIERRHLPGNRKNMHVFLTAKGKKLESTLVPLAEEVNAISVQGLPDRTVATVRKTLIAMIENLAAEDTGVDVDDTGDLK